MVLHITFIKNLKKFLDTPCGGLPLLEINGTTIAQSMAIARFLAKTFNLAGKNLLEEAQADMIVDCVTDFVNSKNDNFLVQKN